MGLAWYMKYFNNYTAYVHNGDFWNFASILCIVPELNLGFWLSSGKGAAESRAKIFQDFADKFYPIGNHSDRVPLKKSNSSLYTTRFYVATRRSYTTSDKFLSLFTSLKIKTMYDSESDIFQHEFKTQNGDLENKFNGFDEYSFVNSESNFAFKFFPFTVFSSIDPKRFIVTIEPTFGLESITFDSDLTVLILLLILFNSNMVIMFVIYSCCKCFCPRKNSFNDYKLMNVGGDYRKRRINCLTETTTTIFANSSMFLFFVLNIAVYILCFNSQVSLIFGFKTGYIIATLLPILGMIIIILQIALFGYVIWAHINWTMGYNIVFVLFILLEIGDLILYFALNLFGPRL